MSEFYSIDFEDYVTKFVPWFMREYDFLFQNGDFRLGNTDEQDQYFIMQARNGHYYQFIRLGVGIDKYLNGDIDVAVLKKSINRNLSYDGFTINNIFIVTQNDVERLNITDPEILSILGTDRFLVAIEASRTEQKDGIQVEPGTGSVVSYIKSSMEAMQTLNDLFYSYVIEKKEELKFNSQIVYLQRRLNDVFDDTLRRIYIANVASLPINYIYRVSELQDDYVYRISEAQRDGFIVGDISEILTDTYDFIVYVPVSLTYNVDRMNSIVNKYKFVDKSFTIQTY